MGTITAAAVGLGDVARPDATTRPGTSWYDIADGDEEIEVQETLEELTLRSERLTAHLKSPYREWSEMCV